MLAKLEGRKNDMLRSKHAPYRRPESTDFSHYTRCSIRQYTRCIQPLMRVAVLTFSLSPLLQDGNSQKTFLRGHDDNISCLDISPQTGNLAATGQCGKNADVLVWDVREQRVLFRCCEHDSGIACLAFSPDERLLVSVGSIIDKRVFVWDTTTGAIVANGSTQVQEPPAQALGSPDGLAP